ncbi:6-phospho-3-hexuloisomerase [Plantactinospora sp. GCM10030261]|uniref:6-phospho-3-hexuloisomerase n=1 Tax=Plantactinospora sp. GCM10030261 TaxID=3273420 RepID=UPI00360FFB6C
MADVNLVRSRSDRVLREVRAVVESVDPTSLAALWAALDRSTRTFFTGQGRSGLMARAIAVRWMHLGRTAHVAGDPVTPAIGAGDLLLCLSANGRTATTVRHARTARAAGARVAVLTANPHGELSEAADLVVTIPVGSAVRTAQHAGSLFEQASLLVGDVLCGALQVTDAIPDGDLDRRHANLQ